jgi:two-component system, cell cycle response regulator CtrA
MRILVIHGDRQTGAALRQGLERGGIKVVTTQLGETGIYLARRQQFDLVLLGLIFPDTPGQTVLRRLKSIDAKLPAVVLSGNRSARVRRRCFTLGADDYIVMPTRVDEIVSRARAIISRKYGHASPYITLGALCIDIQKREVWVNGRTVPIDGPEYQILETLALRSEMIIGEDILISHTVGGIAEPNVDDIRDHVRELRKKLSSIDPKPGIMIETFDAHDFRLNAPEQPALQEEVNFSHGRRRG